MTLYIVFTFDEFLEYIAKVIETCLYLGVFQYKHREIRKCLSY
jgi:hypothetical protein